MPRTARYVADGMPHHVTQRGNARQTVFRLPADFVLYKDLLARYTKKYDVALWAYCLMPNHVHLICVPPDAKALASALNRTHAEYARYFNIANRTCGHLWQSRYYSCPLDNVHTWRAMAYVERNPVRAGIAATAQSYAWSSAIAHASHVIDPMLEMCVWRAQYDNSRWLQVLRTSVGEEAMAQRVREATTRGRPLGDDAFVQRLEEVSGRVLHKRPPGRPKQLVARA